MSGLSIFDLAADAFPVSATPVTLTTRPDRWDRDHLVLHAVTPDCDALTPRPRRDGEDRSDERVLGTGLLVEIAAALTARHSLENVGLCQRCQDPTFRAYKRELAVVAAGVKGWRQLRFDLFRCGKDPATGDLPSLATSLISVAHAAATAESPQVEQFLRSTLRQAHDQARPLRDRYRAVAAVAEGPWVAVGVSDLAAAWRTREGRQYLPYAPGNIFDHPVADAHFFGERARAVIALPSTRARDWCQWHPALVEVTDVPITADQVAHLGLMTRLWVEHAHLDLTEVVQLLACGIAAPACA